MAGNRKLGKTTDIRLAMLKTQATCLLLNGKLETTEARAKEVKPIADSLISLAIKEKDNFEMVDVKVSKAKLDEKGHKVTELVKSKNGKEYLKVVREEITEKRKKDKMNTEQAIPEPRTESIKIRRDACISFTEIEKGRKRCVMTVKPV